MSSAVCTVFAAQAERYRGTVHLVVSTDQGKATMRFTPALAQVVGRELAQRAVQPNGERTAEPTAPITKPSGHLL